MFAKIQTYLFRWLDKRRHLPEEELYRYVLMMAVAVTALLVHLLYAGFYAIVGSTFLAVCQGLGVLANIGSCRLLTRRRYDAAGVVVSLMILFCIVATIVIIGGDNYSIFYQIFVLLLQLVFPFENRKIPMTFKIVMPLLMVGCYLYDVTHVPPYPLGDATHILSVMNILIASIALIVLLTLERSVRAFVESFNRQRMEELQTQANVDPLTGLYNRRYASTYFEQLKDDRRKASSCVAIADIDDFKIVNDTYGHNVGDAVLCNLSGVFTTYLRKSDLVIRWGGEEFLLILMDVDLPEAKLLLDRTREAIQAQVIQAEGQVVQVTMTLGVARLNPQDIEGSLSLCDQRMYEGKRSGKNRVIAE